MNVYTLVIGVLAELVAVVILVAVVLAVGSVGRNRYGERIIGYVDLGIAAIPGVGTVYKRFRRMGDVMLDDRSENFREVRLVECLGEELYLLGFETSRSPDAVDDAAGREEMVTVFLPMAPNPVTGGFLTYVPRDRVVDVDMTVEEGIRSILTSGVATDERAAGHRTRRSPTSAPSPTSTAYRTSSRAPSPVTRPPTRTNGGRSRPAEQSGGRMVCWSRPFARRHQAPPLSFGRSATLRYRWYRSKNRSVLPVGTAAPDVQLLCVSETGSITAG